MSNDSSNELTALIFSDNYIIGEDKVKQKTINNKIYYYDYKQNRNLRNLQQSL